MELFGFLALGIVAGILSGLFGIGGGIVMVPSLIVFFGLDILDANATSLAAMLLPVGILGVLAYYKAGLIDLRDSLWIALGLFVGSFGGGELAVNLDEKVLGGLYAGILLYIAFNYLDVRSWFRKDSKPSITAEALRRPIWAYLLVGLGAGVFAGLFGKGGGIVIVPLLVAFFRYEPKKAAATSLAALQLPVGLPSVVIYAQDGHLHLLNALLIAVGIVFGALLGSKLGVKLPSSMFKKVFGVFLIFVAAYMVLK
jgi:uncharacterized membrane protein YfcA